MFIVFRSLWCTSSIPSSSLVAACPELFLLSLFSVVSKHLGYLDLICAETGETETSPSGSHPKHLNFRLMFLFSLFLPKENPYTGSFLDHAVLS